MITATLLGLEQVAQCPADQASRRAPHTTLISYTAGAPWCSRRSLPAGAERLEPPALAAGTDTVAANHPTGESAPHGSGRGDRVADRSRTHRRDGSSHSDLQGRVQVAPV